MYISHTKNYDTHIIHYAYKKCYIIMNILISASSNIEDKINFSVHNDKCLTLKFFKFICFHEFILKTLHKKLCSRSYIHTRQISVY